MNIKLQSKKIKKKLKKKSKTKKQSKIKKQSKNKKQSKTKKQSKSNKLLYGGNIYNGKCNTIECTVNPAIYGTNKITINFNPNIIKIRYNNIDKFYIISTGHSISGCTNIKFNDNLYSYDTLHNVLTNNNKFYYNSDPKNDFCIFTSDIFDNIFKTIQINNIEYPIKGINNNINKDHIFIKNGCSTKYSLSKLLLKTDKSIMIKPDYINNYNYYKLKIDDKIILLSGNKLTNISQDYIFYPYKLKLSDIYVTNSNFQDLKQLFIDILFQHKNYFIQDNIKTNYRTYLSTIITNDIVIQYYNNNNFMYSSQQGDSGSGYYTCNDYSDIRLVGINDSGCYMLQVSNNHNITEYYDDYYYDTNLKQLKINTFIIEKIYKCSCIKQISDFISDNSQIKILKNF